MKSQKAFTLIELMVTLAITGVLLTLALGSYEGYLAKTRQLEAKELLARIINEQASFRVLCPLYASTVQSGFSLSRDCASRSLTVPFPLQSDSYTLTMQSATANSFEVALSLINSNEAASDTQCKKVVATWSRASIQYSGFVGQCGSGVWR